MVMHRTTPLRVVQIISMIVARTVATTLSGVAAVFASDVTFKCVLIAEELFGTGFKELGKLIFSQFYFYFA